MSAIYVDTSALGRVLLGESDARIIAKTLGEYDARFGSRLVRVELQRLGYRSGVSAEVEQLLEDVSLVDLDEDVLAEAETVTPPSVATLDAIHLVTALRLAARGLIDALMTYDRRLGAAARDRGLEVLAPT